ncbi:hypothetical protein LOTGIDRAFT_118058 [Lottia gigantea]|uniref:VWFA domain-containing protein n=1 Tax=Lottia gigantea TaxID=225164 RepID=V3ZT10_LOTGI|nr:hypothetical protein LOTGIDRAFT_118058 [Lottia gigantea]ESO94583.1 hypothetical protein LOTGIDRAFT_118058 [Lottia gigantea]
MLSYFSVLECKEKVADIIFALDSSDSIWPEDFVKQTDFVQKVVDSLTIGPNNIQIGLVTFGTRIKPYFQLKDHKDKRSVLTAIQSVYALGEGTNTGATLKYIREEMFKRENGGRKWADKIVILITDGVSRDRKETMMEGSLSRLDDIEIFTIGVGYSVDAMELDVIASKPKEKHQFLVENYKSLHHIRHSFTATTCKVSDLKINSKNQNPSKQYGSSYKAESVEQSRFIGSKICDCCKSKPAEVYFVLDSSSSIWYPDFIKQLDFVREVVSLFDMEKDKTRVGVVTYSDGVHPVIPLDAYSMEEFEAKVKKIPYLTGGTSTEAAIQYLREVGFSKDNARSDVAHVGIIVTDGQSRSFEKTAKEAGLAHKQAIQLFAVGVGKAVDEEEMLEIASDPDENYVFRVDDYEALKKIESLLAVKACEGKLGILIIPGNVGANRYLLYTQCLKTFGNGFVSDQFLVYVRSISVMYIIMRYT